MKEDGILKPSASENLFLDDKRTFTPMSDKSLPFKVTPEMEEYIRARSTDLRVATTCEGPLLFSVRISPPKPTDRIITVGGRKIYVSAVQAPHIKAIDASMLPRCALEKKRK
jgi:hypothetical protein